MGARCGFDLGTTNSVVAWSKDGRQADVLVNSQQDRTTPSVVGRHARAKQPDQLLVGAPARDLGAGNPSQTIYSIKRLMGRRLEDEAVERVRSTVPYEIVGDPNSGWVRVRIGERDYSPVEVSAMILEKLRVDASAALGEPVTHAVITVPAYFDDNQKESTRQAGGLAGLRVTRIIEEPTAAAYAFGVDQDTSDGQMILVYDLGGGTFDISLIFLSSGVPTVELVRGDNWLGGDDFDTMIINHVLRETSEEHRIPIADLRADARLSYELKLQAERAKRMLGSAPSADIVLYGAMKGQLDIEATIMASDFNTWIAPSIDRSMALVEETLSGAGLSDQDIDHVLLVGGSTAIPQVRAKLGARFGEAKLKSVVDPMAAVAMGAAVQASRIEKIFCIRGHENEPDATVCEHEDCDADLADAQPQVICPNPACQHRNDRDATVCEKCGGPIVPEVGGVHPKPIGIETGSGNFEIIIPRDTRFPTDGTITREFRTASDDQEWIIFPVLQGSDASGGKPELQCWIVIPEIDEGPIPRGRRAPAGTPLEIGLSLDNDDIVSVQVRGRDALSWVQVNHVVREVEGDLAEILRGKRVSQSCSHCGAINPPEATACVECGRLLHLAEDRELSWQDELLFEKRRAEVAYHDLAWIYQPDQLRQLQLAMDKVDAAIAANDEANGRAVHNEVEKLNDEIVGGVMDLLFSYWAVRMEMGEAADCQKLSSKLEEYKRRAMAGEDPRSPQMQQIRNEIGALLDQLLAASAGAQSVPCRNPRCGKDRPPPRLGSSACPHCGYDPWIPEAS